MRPNEVSPTKIGRIGDVLLRAGWRGEDHALVGPKVPEIPTDRGDSADRVAAGLKGRPGLVVFSVALVVVPDVGGQQHCLHFAQQAAPPGAWGPFADQLQHSAKAIQAPCLHHLREVPLLSIIL